ncbi:DUF2637 domain-containing protein [Actinomadura sp. DC4]|uniref:DUF2637 domain-containing protein n=1 Tax=Actinomadura sp. DC4 TaxID=3055069 RepID=UPI0025B20802|nr:DUF2637 domain-containing protein [Actinomadura sp. DC4]MDN3355834.1 DUF2637 domain-containing protein [Actinomadura sp. DC4]
MIDRLIRTTTALAVMAVAVIAAVISYRHAYELVMTHGEVGATARLVPLTVDGLIWAASMVMLDANRRHQPVPTLAKWSLGVGIVATVGANLAHGMGHGAVGALVSAWPAVALVGSYELLMALIRAEHRVGVAPVSGVADSPDTPAAQPDVPTAAPEAPTLEQVVRRRHEAGDSQRAISRDLNMDRRKIKRIIEQAA